MEPLGDLDGDGFADFYFALVSSRVAPGWGSGAGFLVYEFIAYRTATLGKLASDHTRRRSCPQSEKKGIVVRLAFYSLPTRRLTLGLLHYLIDFRHL